MGDESNPRKVARLRAELQEVEAENRRYFQMKRHTEIEAMLHRRREERILEIKLEFEKMLKVKLQ